MEAKTITLNGHISNFGHNFKAHLTQNGRLSIRRYFTNGHTNREFQENIVFISEEQAKSLKGMEMAELYFALEGFFNS